jgi:hypothetical protein
VVVLILPLLVALSYDAKREPSEDLKPFHRDIADSKTNGYLFLWENCVYIPAFDPKYGLQMQEGTIDWDSAYMDQIRKRRESVIPQVETALAKPIWLTPGPQDVSNFQDLFDDDIAVSDYLSLEGSAAIRAGDFRKALMFARMLQIWASRQIEGSPLFISLLHSGKIQVKAAALCAELLEKEGLEASQIEELEKLWTHEPERDLLFDTVLRNEFANMETYLSRWKSGEISPEDYPKFARLLVKKNLTLNECQKIFRQVRTMSGKTFASETAAYADLQVAHPEKGALFKILDSNFYGTDVIQTRRRYTCKTVAGFLDLFFYPRAMRVRLAIYRWRLSHPDQWPAALGELVPEYLPAVPQDPWNGKPLLWDAASQMIYAVGSDWKPDLPSFSSSNRAWLSTNAASPALRLTRPPWTPKPPPAPPPLKKPKLPAITAPKTAPAAK